MYVYMYLQIQFLVLRPGSFAIQAIVFGSMILVSVIGFWAVVAVPRCRVLLFMGRLC